MSSGGAGQGKRVTATLLPSISDGAIRRAPLVRGPLGRSLEEGALRGWGRGEVPNRRNRAGERQECFMGPRDSEDAREAGTG